MTIPELSIPGRSALHRADFPRWYRERRCKDPDCITLLCIWNPGPLCFVHTAKEKEAERASRPRRSDHQAEQEEREMDELLRTPPMPGLASAA